MSKEVQISERFMRKLCENDLNMTSLKIQKKQHLSAATIQERLERSKQLHKRVKAGTLKNLIFSDENLFTVQQTFSHQNDRDVKRNHESISPVHGKCLYGSKNHRSLWSEPLLRKTENLIVIFSPKGENQRRNLHQKYPRRRHETLVQYYL